MPVMSPRSLPGWALGAGILALATGALVSAQMPGGPAGPPAPPAAHDLKVVKKFDRNKDGRLDAAERKAARAWLGEQPGRTPMPGGKAEVPAARTTPVMLAPTTVPPAGNAPLYDGATLRTLFVDLPQQDWEQELADFYRTDVDVPATVTVDGKKYTDVGVHFRGNTSFFMVPPGLKRSINLSFDFADPKQRLLGYRTVNLLNANEDPSMLRTVLYLDIARRYIPAPRANFSRVVINGEYWGVYVNSQQFNTDFLRDAFNADGGPRWKVPGFPGARGGLEYLGDDVRAYKSVYEIKSKDREADWQALIQLTRAVSETPIDQLQQVLEPILDIEGTLRFLALETVFVNRDGYWARASDYDIYRDIRGRFHVIPHDVNEVMPTKHEGRPSGPPPGGPRPAPGAPAGYGVFPGGPPPRVEEGSVDLDPLAGLDNARTPLRSRLLRVPELQARYLALVTEIATQWLDWSHLGPLAQGYHDLIAKDVRLETRRLNGLDAFDRSLTADEKSLKSFAAQRRAFLLQRNRRAQ